MIKRGGTTWLSPDEAIQAIREAKRNGVLLLGFDGAYLRENATEPSLENSWDYCAAEMPDRYAHAIQFILTRSTRGLSFELVFSDGPLH